VHGGNPEGRQAVGHGAVGAMDIAVDDGHAHT
jgi:hypothetical protein